MLARLPEAWKPFIWDLQDCECIFQRHFFGSSVKLCPACLGIFEEFLGVESRCWLVRNSVTLHQIIEELCRLHVPSVVEGCET